MTDPINNIGSSSVPGSKPAGGSVESGAKLQEMMQNSDMTKEQAAAALAASKDMAQIDPAALLADQLLEDALTLRRAFEKRAMKVNAEIASGTLTSDEVAAKNDALISMMQGVIQAGATALDAHIKMRDEQRKEIIWGEQSQAIAKTAKELTEKATHPIGFNSKWTLPPKTPATTDMSEVPVEISTPSQKKAAPKKGPSTP